MEDIEMAHSLLGEEKWDLVIVKEGQVLFSSKERGVAPLFPGCSEYGNKFT